MPVVRVTRAGVRPAPREVPTDTTLTILPMTFDRVGQEAGEDERPTRVSNLQEAFEKFAPSLEFRTQAGEEGTEFVAELDFKSLKDFDPKQIRARQPGKRNDVADLQARIDLLHRMRERFASLPVKRAWENPEQRREILEAVQEFEAQLRRLAGEVAEGAADTNAEEAR
jgi:type VI secretion system protein ImpB